MTVLVAILAFFQIGMLVGQFISSGKAQADPIGMSVTGGSSPRVTLTGDYTSGGWSTIYTVPDGYQLVITDIHVQGKDYSGAFDSFTLHDPDAGKYLWSGWWGINWGNVDARPAQWHSDTGLVVPAGHRLNIKVWQGYHNIYTIVGFLAVP